MHRRRAARAAYGPGLSRATCWPILTLRGRCIGQQARSPLQRGLWRSPAASLRRRGGVRVGAGLEPAPEGLEVARRLAPGDPPLPLLADRAGEAELEDGVEGLVGVGEHRAEDPVELVVGRPRRAAAGRRGRCRRCGRRRTRRRTSAGCARAASGRRGRGSRRGCGTRTRGRRARARRRRAGPGSGASSPPAASARRCPGGPRRTRSRCRRGRPRTVSAMAESLTPSSHHASACAPPGRRRGCARPSAPRRTRGRAPARPARGGRSRSGSSMSRRRAAAQSRGSWPSTSRPLWPSATTVVSPPTAAATTGVPVACASAATSPKDSLYDGTATAVDAAHQRASSSWATGGHEADHPVEAELGRRAGRATRGARARCRRDRRRRVRRGASAATGPGRGAPRPPGAARPGP